MTDQRIGVIGLGHMGNPMAANLIKAGFQVHVTDRRREAAQDLLAAGATWHDTASGVAGAVDVLITMLPGPPQVDDVMLGSGRAIEAMRPGSVWIDMSTSSHAVARRVEERATGLGVHVLEAPVSGMAKGAIAGTLQIFVGGPITVYERVLPVLQAMGDAKRIFHVGPNGAGYAVKVLINLLWFEHAAATAEVLVMGVRAGVNLDVLQRALVASPANSHFLEHDINCILEHGDYDESFALALACKDLALATDLGRDTGTPVEVAALVEQIHRRALAQYGPAGGEMLAVKLVEDLTGTPLRRAGKAGNAVVEGGAHVRANRA